MVSICDASLLHMKINTMDKEWISLFRENGEFDIMILVSQMVQFIDEKYFEWFVYLLKDKHDFCAFLKKLYISIIA